VWAGFQWINPVRRLTQLFLHIFNLRMLVLLAAGWMLMRAPLPDAVSEWREQLQAHLFRIGLHLSELPLPQTHITVVHVPDIEYERWQVDLPGAGTLQQFLAKADEKALIGLVLEQPLVLVQPMAEGYLQEIQQGRRRGDMLYAEVQALLARRESLVAELKSPRLVLGLTDQSSHFYRRIPVQESFQQYPRPLRDWLWPWPEPSPAPVVSPVLQYFPIDSAPSQERRLASLEGDKVIPMFPLQFWAASQGYPAGSGSATAIHWERDSGFVLGVEQIPTSVGAEIVPVYGAFSGIRASMKQITLGAALAGEGLTGWILLGRDGSPTLEQSAQVIASLGDRAFLHEPAWWALVQMGLLVCVAVFLVVLLPLMQLRWALGFAIVGLIGLATGQILGQILFSHWLPVGNVLLFGGAGLLAMLLHSAQRAAWQRQRERSDDACRSLALAAIDAGKLEEAWQHLRDCRATPATLDALYRIAEAYELRSDFPQSLAVLRDLRRRRLRYRDVSQRIKRLRACVVYQQEQSSKDQVDATVPKGATSEVVPSGP